MPQIRLKANAAKNQSQNLVALKKLGRFWNEKIGLTSVEKASTLNFL